MGIKNGFKRIGRFFSAFTARAYRAVIASPVGRLFGSYAATDAYFQNTAMMRALRPRPNKKNKNTVRRVMARAMDQSLLRRAAYGILHGLGRCSLRTVGVFFAVAGVYSAVISWLLSVLWERGGLNGLHLFLSLAVFLFGFLLMFSPISVGHALEKGRLTGGILHRLLGVSADYIKQMPAQGAQMYAVAVPLGMLTGTAVALTGPAYPALALLLCALMLLILTTPEAGILLLLVFAPFIGFLPYSELWLAMGIALCGFGYLFKILRGTRAFRMEIQDFAVLLLLLLTLLSGVSAVGTNVLWRVALSALLIFAYFPAVNVLSTPNWLKRCRWGLLTSAIVTAVIGILQFLLALLQSRPYAVPSMDELGAFVCAGFSSNFAFACFMVIAFPFAMHAFLRATSASRRILAGFGCMAILAAVALTWVQSAWLALLIEIIVLLLLCKRASFIYILLALIVLPVVVLMLPPSVRTAIFAFMGADASVGGTEIAAQIFFGDGEGFFSRANGIFRMIFGLGADGVERVGVLYVPSYLFPLGERISFWWARWFESGILGLALSAALCFFLLQNCFSLLPYDANVKSAVAPASGIAMVTGFLLLSAFGDVGRDPAAVLLIFLLVAIVTADARNRRGMRAMTEQKIQSSTYIEMEYRPAREKRRKKKKQGEEINTHE